MPTSCISTTTSETESKMYPWRRVTCTFADSVVNEASITKPFNKKLSATAPEFVPRWARQENTDCIQICLDGYSDDDDEPESLKVVPSSAKAPSAAVADGATPQADTLFTKEEPTPAARNADSSSELVPASRTKTGTRRSWGATRATPSADAPSNKEEQTATAAKDNDNFPELVGSGRAKIGTQRPWRVSRGNLEHTTEIVSSSNPMSVTETSMSKLPWRSGSWAEQRALAKAATAAGLPPWKRAAPWKPLSTDEQSEPGNTNQSPVSTTDSSASISTVYSDSNASEESPDNETADDTPRSSQEQNASSENDTIEGTSSDSGEQDTHKNRTSGQESCTSATEHAADDTHQKLKAERDERTSDITNDELGAKIDEVSSQGSEAQDQETDDNLSSRNSETEEQEEKLMAENDEKPAPEKAEESSHAHAAQETKQKLAAEEFVQTSGKSEVQEDEDDDTKERCTAEAQDASVDEHIAEDSSHKVNAGADEESSQNSEAEEEVAEDTKQKLAAEKDVVNSQNLEAQENDADDTKDKLISEDSDAGLQEREHSQCETEPEPEEDLPPIQASSYQPEQDEEDAPAMAGCSVLEFLKWRSAFGSDEVSNHEVPGRLIACAEPTSEPCKPQCSQPRTFPQSRAKRSAVASPSLTTPSTNSCRPEALEQGETDEHKVWRSEAAKTRDSNKLQASENSWIAKMRARRGQQGESSDEEVVRAMKGILNKLTIEKFPQLYQQMISCGIRTSGHLEQLIQEVFEKATTQHHFIDMYADLCAHLNTHFKENPIVDNPSMTFKHILLNACQASFEKNLAPPDNLASLNPEERAAAEFEYKMRTIGNIRLVGALLVRKMLASKVMFAIAEELLGNPTSEALETLAALLTAVGAEFDRPTFANRVALNALFLQVQTIAKKKTTAARIRCLLKDVLDLRAAGWLDKKPKKIEKPTTLGEVHQKAAMENGNPVSLAPASRSSPEEWTTIPQKSTANKPVASVGTPSKTLVESKGQCSIARQANTAPSKVASEEQQCKATSLPVEASKDHFDHKVCLQEIVKALNELFVSHEIDEAVLCVVDLGVPASHQATELCDILSFIAEEGSAEKRKIGFAFVAKLFLGRHWKSAALADGLHNFVEEICAELKVDVPALPRILREELHPALVPAVDAGILKASRHNILTMPTF